MLTSRAVNINRKLEAGFFFCCCQPAFIKGINAQALQHPHATSAHNFCLVSCAVLREDCHMFFNKLRSFWGSNDIYSHCPLFCSCT